jgi:Zn-dependent M28 family amino/carboxypeptidase
MTYDIEYPVFRDITVSNLKKYGINLSVDYQPSADPQGGSDHRSFVAKGIPIMRFKPGHREEYHMPSDENSTLDWDIMEKIIKISFTNIWELANSEW